MRFVSFMHRNRASWGRIVGDEIADLGALPNAPSDLQAAIAAGALDNRAGAATLARADVKLLPVVPVPSKIL